jgi:hypothetical protein
MKNIFVFLLIVFATKTVYAQKPSVVTSDKPGWHKIGEITADFAREKESIVVLGADEFKSIKFKVTDAPITSAMVNYESGSAQEIPVNNNLQAGTETKSYDLSNPNRDIKNVTFNYKTLPNYKGEKAHVELYGLK